MVSLLLIIIVIHVIKNDILHLIKLDEKIELIEAKNMTIQQLSEHINKLNNKLKIKEDEINQQKLYVNKLTKLLNEKKGIKYFDIIGDLTIDIKSNGDVIKIGN